MGSGPDGPMPMGGQDIPPVMNGKWRFYDIRHSKFAKSFPRMWTSSTLTMFTIDIQKTN